MIQLNRWCYHTRQNGHNGDYSPNSSRCSHRVSSHRLDGTDGHTIGMISEAYFDGLCLCPVIVWGRSAMSVDVVYLLGMYPSFLQRSPHSLHQSYPPWC